MGSPCWVSLGEGECIYEEGMGCASRQAEPGANASLQWAIGNLSRCGSKGRSLAGPKV